MAGAENANARLPYFPKCINLIDIPCRRDHCTLGLSKKAVLIVRLEDTADCFARNSPAAQPGKGQLKNLIFSQICIRNKHINHSVRAALCANIAYKYYIK